jgi:hypothetical protein
MSEEKTKVDTLIDIGIVPEVEEMEPEQPEVDEGDYQDEPSDEDLYQAHLAEEHKLDMEEEANGWAKYIDEHPEEFMETEPDIEPEFDVKPTTKRSIYFSKMMPIIPLYGEAYIPIKVAAIYTILAHRVRTLKLSLFGKEFDMRFNYGLCSPPASGKKDISVFFSEHVPNERAEVGGRSFVTPTSIHAEQLIGRIDKVPMKKGELNYIPVAGYLGTTDFVVLDESVRILNDKKYKEII